jgi:hypothetical protein
VPVEYSYIKRLLTGKNRLTKEEKEDIFLNTWSAVAKEQYEESKKGSRRAWRMIWATATILLIAGAGLLIWRGKSVQPGSMGTLTPRGHSESSDIAIRCASSQSNRCGWNDALGFRIKENHMNYFAAFAIHQDSQKVLWYFPEHASSSSLNVSRHREVNGWLDRVIQIDNAHPAGRYEVVGVSSSIPLSRAQIRMIFEPKKSLTRLPFEVHIDHLFFNLEVAP